MFQCYCELTPLRWWCGKVSPLVAAGVFQHDGTYIEWRAEDLVAVDGQSDQDWAVIGGSVSSVSYKNDREADSGVSTHTCRQDLHRLDRVLII